MLSVAKVVLNVIALVFQGIEGFIFDFPACPAPFDQGDHIVFIYFNVSHPAVFIGDFAGFGHKLILEKIDQIGIFCTIYGNLVNLLIPMAATFIIAQF